MCFPIRISGKRLVDASRRLSGRPFCFDLHSLGGRFPDLGGVHNKTLRRVFISACEQDAPNLNIGEAVSWDGSIVTLAKSDSPPLEVRAAIAEVKALFAAEPQ